MRLASVDVEFNHRCGIQIFTGQRELQQPRPAVRESPTNAKSQRALALMEGLRGLRGRIRDEWRCQ
jgi:hypothetical protein